MKAEYVITLEPHEFKRMKWNTLGPSGDMGGYQEMENWLINNHKPDGTIALEDARLGKLIRYILRYGSGGPNGRIRDACIAPLRREGVSLLGWN